MSGINWWCPYIIVRVGGGFIPPHNLSGDKPPTYHFLFSNQYNIEFNTVKQLYRDTTH